MPRKYVHIDGVAALVYHAGQTTLPEDPPDTSRGRTLLGLHGYGGNAGELWPALERLADRHSPVAFDQPGHGRSGELDSLGRVERMAAFARDVARRLALERPVLVGHTLGSAVAIEYALAWPDAVGALVLCSPAPRWALPDALVERTRRVTQGKERRDLDRESFSPGSGPEVLRAAFMEGMKTDPRATLGDLEALRAYDALERLGGIRAPVLLVLGEDDRLPVRALAHESARRLPGARLVEIPKAGQMLPLEQPEALASCIGDFLGALAA